MIRAAREVGQQEPHAVLVGLVLDFEVANSGGDRVLFVFWGIDYIVYKVRPRRKRAKNQKGNECPGKRNADKKGPGK